MKSYILCSGIWLVLMTANVFGHSVTHQQPRVNLSDTSVINPNDEFANLQPTIGVVSEDVAKQRLITYGIDKINDFKRVGNTYQISAIVDGVSTELEIDGLLGAVKNKATQLVIRPPFPNYERVMNWGEAIVAPDLLSVTDKQVFDFPPFKVRFYPSSKTYLGYNLDDGFIYIYNPDMFGSGIKQLEPLSNYLPAAFQEGF